METKRADQRLPRLAVSDDALVEAVHQLEGRRRGGHRGNFPFDGWGVPILLHGVFSKPACGPGFKATFDYRSRDSRDGRRGGGRFSSSCSAKQSCPPSGFCSVRQTPRRTSSTAIPSFIKTSLSFRCTPTSPVHFNATPCSS